VGAVVVAVVLPLLELVVEDAGVVDDGAFAGMIHPARPGPTAAPVGRLTWPSTGLANPTTTRSHGARRVAETYVCTSNPSNGLAVAPLGDQWLRGSGQARGPGFGPTPDPRSLPRVPVQVEAQTRVVRPAAKAILL
jgi:hypothetical protein